MQNRPRVGEILVSAGIIDDLQLDAALGEQKRWGRRLGVTLIKMGMVEEGHLIRALAKQLDLPVASLAGKRIPEDVIALVPARMASEHGVIPLFTKDGGRNGQLFLGMEDPSNLAVLDDLSFRTGMEIHPVMVGPTELGEAIDRYYHARDGGAPQSDPFRGDTMNPGSLRVVTDDSPQPGTAPAEPSIEAEIRATSGGRPTKAHTPPIELKDAVETASSASAETWEMPEDLTGDLARIDEALETLRSDLARVSDEVAGVRENVTGVQGRVETVQSTVSNMQADVLRVRDEVADEKPGETDLEPIQADVSRLQEDVSKLADALAVLRGEFERLSDDPASGPAETAAAPESVTAATDLATRAHEESERTRIVAKAITTLLVEKGVVGLDALQAQISLLKAAAEVDDDGGDLEPLDG